MRFSNFARGALAAAFVGAVSTASFAAPLPALSTLKDTGAAQSQVEQTHGWHRSCQRGLNGWHKHVRGVGRIQCGNAKCWTNKWGYKRCSYY